MLRLTVIQVSFVRVGICQIIFPQLQPRNHNVMGSADLYKKGIVVLQVVFVVTVQSYPNHKWNPSIQTSRQSLFWLSYSNSKNSWEISDSTHSSRTLCVNISDVSHLYKYGLISQVSHWNKNLQYSILLLCYLSHVFCSSASSYLILSLVNNCRPTYKEQCYLLFNIKNI